MLQQGGVEAPGQPLPQEGVLRLDPGRSHKGVHHDGALRACQVRAGRRSPLARAAPRVVAHPPCGQAHHAAPQEHEARGRRLRILVVGGGCGPPRAPRVCGRSRGHGRLCQRLGGQPLGRHLSNAHALPPAESRDPSSFEGRSIGTLFRGQRIDLRARGGAALHPPLHPPRRRPPGRGPRLPGQALPVGTRRRPYHRKPRALGRRCLLPPPRDAALGRAGGIQPERQCCRALPRKVLQVFRGRERHQPGVAQARDAHGCGGADDGRGHHRGPPPGRAAPQRAGSAPAPVGQGISPREG
mmetsp:Transcript_32664/g.104117  ORF Transcript_32664/g.104117 Transcript_32664/m.104117 type:complete len:298 (+) Transcript_32664:1137-2030(+)